MNVVGEPVKQSAGEPLGAEYVGPLVEGQVGGDQDGAPFVALAEDLEEEFRIPVVERGTKPNSSMMRSLRRASCRCRLSSRRSSLASMTARGPGPAAVGEAYGHSLLAGGQAQTQGHVGLAGATVADGDDILPMLDVFTPGQFHDQLFVHRGYGQEVEGVQAFDGRETGRPGSGAAPCAGVGQ